VGKRLHLCTVGKKPSAATCYLNDPAEVLELLGTLGKHVVSVRANRFSLNDLSSLSPASMYGGLLSRGQSNDATSPRSPAGSSTMSPTSSGLGLTAELSSTPMNKEERSDSIDGSAAPLAGMGAPMANAAAPPTGMGARSFSMTALASMNLKPKAITHSTSTTFQQFMENIVEEDDDDDDEGGIFF
jgi:hypothetical protein